jgi:hypothetical protein
VWKLKEQIGEPSFVLPWRQARVKATAAAVEAQEAAGVAGAIAIAAAAAAVDVFVVSAAITAAASTRMQWMRVAIDEAWCFDPWTGNPLEQQPQPKPKPEAEAEAEVLSMVPPPPRLAKMGSNALFGDFD